MGGTLTRRIGSASCWPASTHQDSSGSALRGGWGNAGGGGLVWFVSTLWGPEATGLVVGVLVDRGSWAGVNRLLGRG